MQLSRSVKSEQIEKRSPSHEREDSIKKTNKNMVKVNPQRSKLSPSPQQFQSLPLQSPKEPSPEDKSLLSEQIRIKGQEKLLYVKQCHAKKWEKERIFENYPFSNMQCFTFNDEALRDEHGNFSASILEDQNGIHLVQQYRQNLTKSKYITKEEQELQAKYNGLSVSIFHDGMIFQGNYHDGKVCGTGYQLHPNGNTFIGQFKDGIKNGEGSYYWFSNNEMYTGEWMGGLPHGYGMYASKDKYEGTFSNGLKFGFGEEEFGNGDKYVGEYVNSVAEGYGEYFWADGSFYKGDFKQGVRHGYGIWQDKKEIYKGSYRMDKKEGFGIYKWIGKQIYKGEFRDDYREGYGEFASLMKDDKEKVVYRGCWLKGKKNEEGKIDENRVKQLYAFLDESYKLDLDIEQNSKKQPKKRAGHKNCVPNDPYHNSPTHHHK